VAPMCPPMWALWRHLANTIEPSICGGDAVLCQITLTTCLLFPFLIHFYLFSSFVHPFAFLPE